MENFSLLVADCISLKRCRRFHRGQTEKLHKVIRNHVAQRARSIEVSAALLHADGFGIGDLHVIDVATVPDGLENSVVEPEDHDVLYGLLAEVMIDAVDLIFVQHTFDLAVQSLSRLQIVSERLLDYNTSPAPLLL